MRITENDFQYIYKIKKNEPENNIIVLSSGKDSNGDKQQRKFYMMKKNQEKDKGENLDFSA